ncbi:MAG: GerW family sporulation protein [Candidatus Spyradocola sp.]|jgi:sporulation protein YtfJ
MAHPIETIMRTTMENLKDMIDVNTVVGTPVHTGEGLTIIPVSRVSFGFVAGGGEYAVNGTPVPLEVTDDPLPFAGGTGAGVTVNPVAFLIVGNGQVRLLPAQNNTSIDRLIEMIPQILDDIKGMLPCKKETHIPL